MADIKVSSDSTEAVTPTSTGGVVSSRPTHQGNPLQRKFTADKKVVDVELASIADAEYVDERDFHKKQVSHGPTASLLMLTDI